MSGWYEKGVGDKREEPASQKPSFQTALMPGDFREEPKGFADRVVDSKNFCGRVNGYYDATNIPRTTAHFAYALMEYVVNKGYKVFKDTKFDDLPGEYGEDLAVVRNQFVTTGNRFVKSMNDIFPRFFGGNKWAKGWSNEKIPPSAFFTAQEADRFWYEISKFAIDIDAAFSTFADASTIARDAFLYGVRNAPENFAKGVGMVLGGAGKIVGKAVGGAAGGIFAGLQTVLGKPVLYGGMAVLGYLAYKLLMAGRLNLQKSAAVQPKVVRYEYVGIDDKGIQKKLKKRMG